MTVLSTAVLRRARARPHLWICGYCWPQPLRTTRVEITPTLYVLPMHSATRVAKEMATLDILSGGRVGQCCVGYGGREQDYAAVGARFKGRYGRMDQQVEEMRSVWRGEEMVPGAGPIGPAPQPRRAANCSPAHWDPRALSAAHSGQMACTPGPVTASKRSWQTPLPWRMRPGSAPGGADKPYRLGGFWYTLADDGQQKLYDYVYEYLAIAGPEIATMMAESVHRSSADAVREALDNAEAAGCEEVFLVPATAEMSEIERLAKLLAER